MKVKLLISRAGADFVQSQGDEIEVSAEEAKRMIDSGQAEAVGQKKETATKKVATEKATKV